MTQRVCVCSCASTLGTRVCDRCRLTLPCRHCSHADGSLISFSPSRDDVVECGGCVPSRAVQHFLEVSDTQLLFRDAKNSESKKARASVSSATRWMCGIFSTCAPPCHTCGFHVWVVYWTSAHQPSWKCQHWPFLYHVKSLLCHPTSQNSFRPVLRHLGDYSVQLEA